MHTLCLLDIKVKEPDFEAMKKGRTVFLPPRYMSVNTAAEQLIEAEEKHGEGAYNPKETLCWFGTSWTAGSVHHCRYSR